ncbi:hypothetical protein A2U01_0045521, partial [Trifolium medium]|nr:hypothetical protein [Trifolium medium]
ESISVLEGLHLAWECSYKNVELQVDSKVVVNMLRCENAGVVGTD